VKLIVKCHNVGVLFASKGDLWGALFLLFISKGVAFHSWYTQKEHLMGKLLHRTSLGF